MFVSNCVTCAFSHFYSIHLLTCIFLFTDYFLFIFIFLLFICRHFLSTYFCSHFVLLIGCSTCFVCLVNGCVMQIGHKVWFEYENVCGLYVLFVWCHLYGGFMYEFISDMTKVGWFHVWVHVRHQKGRSWGGRAYIYIYNIELDSIYIYIYVQYHGNPNYHPLLP